MRKRFCTNGIFSARKANRLTKVRAVHTMNPYIVGFHGGRYETVHGFGKPASTEIKIWVAKTCALGYNIRIHRRAFGRRKRTDRLIRFREPPGGARRRGGRLIRSFHAAGDEPAGRRPLSVKRGHENGNLGGNAEHFVPCGRSAPFILACKFSGCSP